MAQFKPSFPYAVRAELLIPTYTTDKGVRVKSYPDDGDGEAINVSFKTYGGTEQVVDGIYSVIDTATVETWYRPDLTSDCRIRILATDQTYEIIGAVENIDMRGQFAKFKVKAVKGGA